MFGGNHDNNASAGGGGTPTNPSAHSHPSSSTYLQQPTQPTPQHHAGDPALPPTQQRQYSAPHFPAHGYASASSAGAGGSWPQQQQQQQAPSFPHYANHPTSHGQMLHSTMPGHIHGSFPMPSHAPPGTPAAHAFAAGTGTSHPTHPQPPYPTDSQSLSPRVPRVYELLESLDEEVKQVLNENMALRTQRGESDFKLSGQQRDVSAFESAIYEFERKHHRLKNLYEEEIMRLRRELDSRGIPLPHSNVPDFAVPNGSRSFAEAPPPPLNMPTTTQGAGVYNALMQSSSNLPSPGSLLTTSGSFHSGYPGGTAAVRPSFHSASSSFHPNQTQAPSFRPPSAEQGYPYVPSGNLPASNYRRNSTPETHPGLASHSSTEQRPQSHRPPTTGVSTPGSTLHRPSTFAYRPPHPDTHSSPSHYSNSMTRAPPASTPTHSQSDFSRPTASQHPAQLKASGTGTPSPSASKEARQNDHGKFTALKSTPTGVLDTKSLGAPESAWKKHPLSTPECTTLVNTQSPALVGKSASVRLVHNFEHSSVVCSVCFSKDGKYLATGSNHAVHIYNVPTGTKVCATKTDLYVRCMTFSPTGEYLATGAEDRIIRIWHVDSQSIKYSMTGHTQDIYSIDWCFDGSVIVSGSGDKTVRVWNPNTGGCRMTLLNEFPPSSPNQGNVDFGVTSVCLSPVYPHALLTGSLDCAIRLWDLRSGKVLEKFTSHTHSVYAVSFSPNGLRFCSGSLDKSVMVWELSQKSLSILANQLHDQPGPPLAGTVQFVWTKLPLHHFVGHSDFVLSVGYWGKIDFAEAGDVDVDWVVSGSKDRGVIFWNAKTGTEVSHASVPQLMLQGHRNSVISVALFKQGTLFATGSGDCRAKVWKLESSNSQTSNRNTVSSTNASTPHSSVAPTTESEAPVASSHMNLPSQHNFKPPLKRQAQDSLDEGEYDELEEDSEGEETGDDDDAVKDPDFK